MSYYLSVGDVPPKRHTQHRDPDGRLYREELMGEEGFSSDSSLLYHRGVPSAIVDSQVWDIGDQTRTPNHPLKPRHLKLHSLFPEGTTGDAVTGRRLVLGNNDVRISYVVTGDESAVAVLPQRDRRRVRVRRVRQRRRRDALRARELPGRRLRHRPAGHDAPVAARRAVPALPDRGEQPHPPAEALPVAVRAAAGARAVLRARPASAGRAARRGGHGRRGAGQAPHVGRDRRHPDDLRDAPVRRGRLGRLPLPVHVQRRGLRADHRAGAPAAAGAPGLRGLELRGLQLLPAEGRLPPAGHPGALLPLERRQRRGHVLRRRRLRGAQGVRHQRRLDLAAPGRLCARTAAVGDRGVAGRGVLRRAGGHGGHVRAARPGRGRARGARTRRTPGPGPDVGRTRAATATGDRRSSRTRDRPRRAAG